MRGACPKIDLRSKTLIADVEQALRVYCPGEICYDKKIPNLPSSYALILALWRDCDTGIGRPGHLHFKSGYAAMRKARRAYRRGLHGIIVKRKRFVGISIVCAPLRT